MSVLKLAKNGPKRRDDQSDGLKRICINQPEFGRFFSSLFHRWLAFDGFWKLIKRSAVFIERFQAS